MIDICCNVNTINTKEGDDLTITMQIKLQPTKEERALLDFTMQEYISLVNDILDYAIASDIMPINPAYTSQTCPCCGKRNHANDRNYVCSCGYHTHRDRLGAVNILTA